MKWNLLYKDAGKISDHLFTWADRSLPVLAYENEKGLFWLTLPPELEADFPVGIVTDRDFDDRDFWRLVIRLTEPMHIDLAHYWHSHQNISCQNIMMAMNLTVNYKSIEEWKELGTLGRQATNLAKKTNLPLSVLRLFNRFNEDECEDMIKIFDLTNMKKNYMREFIQSYYDLDRDRRKEFLSDAMMLIPSGEEKTSKDSSERILEEMRKVRYPALSKYREKLKQAKNQISLPRGLRMEVAEDFESREIRFEFAIRSPDEIDSICKKLNSNRNIGAFQTIFKLLE